MGLDDTDVALNKITLAARVPPDMIPGREPSDASPAGASVSEARIVIIDMALVLFALLTKSTTTASSLTGMVIARVRKHYTAGAQVVVLSCDVGALVTGAKQEEQRARSASSKLSALSSEEIAALGVAIPQAARLRRNHATGDDPRGSVIHRVYQDLADAFYRGILTRHRTTEFDCALVLDGGMQHQTSVLSHKEYDMSDMPAFIPPVGEADLRIGAFLRYFIRRSARLRQDNAEACRASVWHGWSTIRVISKDSDMCVILALALIAERESFVPLRHLCWEDCRDDPRLIGEYMHRVACASVRSEFGPVFLTANKDTTYDVVRIATRLCFLSCGQSPMEAVFRLHLIGSDFVSASWAKRSLGSVAAAKRIIATWMDRAEQVDASTLSVAAYMDVCARYMCDPLIVDAIDSSGHWTVQIKSEDLAAFLVSVDAAGQVTRAGKTAKLSGEFNVAAALVASSNALFASIMQANGTLVSKSDPARSNHPCAVERDARSGLPLWGWINDGAPLRLEAGAAHEQEQEQARVVRASVCALSRSTGLFPVLS